MKSPRAFLLEIGIFFSLAFAPLSFGAVYGWGYGTLAAAVFGLLFFTPQAFFDFPALPHFSRWGSLAVGLWLVCQTLFFSKLKSVASTEALSWLAAATVFLLMHRLKRDAILRLFQAFILIGALVSIYGLWQVVTGSEWVLWHKKEAHRGFVTGTYLNRNHYAGLMELVLGVHLGCFIRAVHKSQMKTALVLALLWIPSFAGFLKSGSRSGLICFTAALCMLSFFLIHRTGKKTFFILFLIFLGCAGGGILGWNTAAARFQETAGDLMTLEGRLTVWKSMTPMLRDYFWTGIGLGNFKWVFPLYQQATLDYGWSHAHQDYFELAIEMGVPAFVVWIACVMTILGSCFARTESKDFSTFALIWGTAVGLIAISLHGFTDFNFAIPGNVFLFALLLGAAHRLLDFERQTVVREKTDP